MPDYNLADQNRSFQAILSRLDAIDKALASLHTLWFGDDLKLVGGGVRDTLAGHERLIKMTQRLLLGLAGVVAAVTAALVTGWIRG